MNPYTSASYWGTELGDDVGLGYGPHGAQANFRGNQNKCPKCGGWKVPAQTLCYECNKALAVSTLVERKKRIKTFDECI